MGRVDEARRRAADAAANAEPVADEPAASVPLSTIDDAETLAREPYPIEIAERRRARAVPPPTPQAPPESQKTTVSEPPPATPPPPPSGRLFERLNTTLARKLVVDDAMMPASREQYRRLAATLHQQQAASGLKVVMISSAVGGEGKTLTASNLALTFSESYRRSVLLIDGDLRRPSLHNVFNIKDSVGLSEGLSQLEEKPLTLHQITQRLTVLPAGRAISDPMAGLTSDRMRRLIEEAREAFDWVIIDTPPVGILTDANLLASMVDGAVLVIKAEATPYQLAQRAVEALGRNRILGVVLNRALAPLDGTKYGYYNYYYDGQKQLPSGE
jgi:capsular exopolysaccharide synthesis family protein